MLKVLLTGKNGQLGLSCQKYLLDNSEMKWIECIAQDSKQLNISDFEVVKKRIEFIKPDIIINTAAHTKVDFAEDDVSNSFLVNGIGIENLAKIARLYNIPIIHISTDYVFDGNSDKPYLPTDKVNPQSIYGKSKLAGENALINNLSSHVIIRTSWVFSEYGDNFVKSMIRAASNRSSLNVVSDQIGSPTYAGDIAEIIFKVCKKIKDNSMNWGVYHFTGGQNISWFEFANLIFEKAKMYDVIDYMPQIIPVASVQYPTKAKRPNYSVLNCQSLINILGLNALPNLENGLNLTLVNYKERV